MKLSSDEAAASQAASGLHAALPRVLAEVKPGPGLIIELLENWQTSALCVSLAAYGTLVLRVWRHREPLAYVARIH